MFTYQHTCTLSCSKALNGLSDWARYRLMYLCTNIIIVYVYALTHTYIHTYIFVNATHCHCVRVCMNIHILIRTQINTHTHQYTHTGGVGYFSNERAFSVESSLQGISSFVLVKTKELVDSNVNVILTRQICGQRSSMSAGSKRRALANYFSIQICSMFLITKCRGESDSVLCTTSGLAKRMRLRCADIRLKNVFGCKDRRQSARTAVFFLQVPKLCTDLDRTLLYVLILRTHNKFVLKKYMLALGVCFLQPCSSAGRRFAASRSRLHY